MANPNIKPLKGPKYVRMAMVGAPGFGKTVFAGTAPNALFLTTDPEGTASAAAYGSTAQEWECTSERDLIAAYNYLEKGGIASDGFEWVVVDNLTEVQAIFMSEAMRLAVERKPDRSPYVPDKHEYLTAQNATVQFVKKMIGLPVNLIFTVHRKGMEDPDGQPFYSVAIQGRDGEIAAQILGYMNVVGMGEVVEFKNDADQVVSKRRIYFDAVREYRGKDRFVKLGKYRDDLTVPLMLNLLYPDGQDQEVTATPSTRPRPQRRA